MQRLKNWTVRKISWTPYFEVVDSFYWLLDYNYQNGFRIIAEKGFRTNYGSIPAIFRIIFDPTRYNSYVIHDEMYTHKRKFHQLTHRYHSLSREEADQILLDGITYEGAGLIERICIYLGVRAFGWIAWNN